MATTRRTPTSQASTLGSPSITTPRAVDLTAVQGAVNNIRERIETVEAFAAATRSLLTGGGNKSADVLDFLQVQVNSLKAQADALAAQVKALGEGEPDDGRLSRLSAVVAELVKQAQDNSPPDPIHAVVAELAKRVDAIEPGLLL